MADLKVKISEFPLATESKDTDDIAILQDGVNKRIKTPKIEEKILDKVSERYVNKNQLGVNNGVATLGADGLLSINQRPVFDVKANFLPINLLTPPSEVDGVFVPTESGVYENYGNIEIDLNEGTFIITKIGDEYKKSLLAVKSPESVDTIEDLRLREGDYNGQIVTLLGYYEAGDKEPLNYIYTSEQVEDDGGAVINTEAGSWLAVIGNLVNVDIFGCNEELLDNSIYINKAISYINQSQILMIDKEYKISIPSNYGSAINLKSNIKVCINGALLTNSNNYDNYKVLNIDNISNVVIYGNGKIIGDKNTHSGSTGEWGMGINIVNGSRDIYVSGIGIYECWGDGVYIGGSTGTTINYNIHLKNIISDSNRRQGLSITHAYDCFIDNCTFSNTSGTLPSAGIDLEPNSGQLIYNVYIDNCNIYGNEGAGVDFYNTNDNDSLINVFLCKNNISNNNDGIKCKNIYNVHIINNNINSNNRYGINLYSDLRNIFIDSNEISNNLYHGIGLITVGQSFNSSNIYIKNNNIVDNSKQSINSYDGIRIDNLDSNYGVNNVYIHNNTIYNHNLSNYQRYGISKSGNNMINNVFLFNNNVYNLNTTTVTGNYNLFIGINSIAKRTISNVAPSSNNNLGDFYYNTTFNQLRYYNGTEWIDIMRVATPSSRGDVYQSSAVSNITTSDATDLATALTLVNELKAKLNAKLTADRNSGQQAT